MPLWTASSRAASSRGSLSPEAWRTMSRPNSDPAAAVSSRRSVVAGARRGSRWATHPRTLSGGPGLGRAPRQPLPNDLAHALRGPELRQRPGGPNGPADDLHDAGLDQGPPQLADQ